MRKPDSIRISCVVLSLCLIGTGQFNETVTLIQDADRDINNSQSITYLFNYAMAQWGKSGGAPVPLLEKIADLIDLANYDYDANFAQCVALVYAALGRRSDAMHSLTMARHLLNPGPVFSCWRYRRVDRAQMSQDLNELGTFIVSDRPLPRFLREVRDEQVDLPLQ